MASKGRARRRAAASTRARVGAEAAQQGGGARGAEQQQPGGQRHFADEAAEGEQQVGRGRDGYASSPPVSSSSHAGYCGGEAPLRSTTRG